MNVNVVCILGALALFSAASAAEKKQEWTPEFQPFSGRYQVYSGSPSERRPPTSSDKQASIVLTGRAAKDMFDQIGPDVKDACSSDPNYRERRKGHLDCSYTKENGYQCFIGIDLRTGKSMNGSVC